MAMVRCPECRKQISALAATCPHCGVSAADRTRIKADADMAAARARAGCGKFLLYSFGAIVIGMIGLSVIGGMLERSMTPEERAARAKADQEERAAEAVRKQEEDARRAIENRRQGAAMATAAVIKQALRDPSSVVWHQMLVSDDASVICVEYGARNGFGGMNRELVVVAAGKVQQSAKAWAAHCIDHMNDLRWAVD